jgi:hypothetical protein
MVERILRTAASDERDAGLRFALPIFAPEKGARMRCQAFVAAKEKKKVSTSRYRRAFQTCFSPADRKSVV